MSTLPNIVDDIKQYLYKNVFTLYWDRAGAGVRRVTDTQESVPQTGGVCSPVYTQHFIDGFVGFLWFKERRKEAAYLHV